MPRPKALSLTIMSLVIVAAGCGQPGGSSDASIPVTAPSAQGSTPTASPAGPGPTAASLMPSSSSGPADAARDELPTRIVIKGLDIDLPVVSGDLDVPGNPPDYPLCDVAQYLTTYPYPGRPGTTTWIYGHAREGMFLPLLEASKAHHGASLIGQMAEVYTDGGRRFEYRITEVLPHSTDRSSARDVPADGGRLVLQTSEGPSGTVPKLQVVAELDDVALATKTESSPSAEPRGCFIP